MFRAKIPEYLHRFKKEVIDISPVSYDAQRGCKKLSQFFSKDEEKEEKE